MEWLTVWIFCGIVAASIASGRGRSGCAWLLLGILFGPFSFAVALMPRVTSAEKEILAKCPFCAEAVRPEAVKCKHCGSEIPVTAGTIIAASKKPTGGDSGQATNWLGLIVFVAALFAVISFFSWLAASR